MHSDCHKMQKKERNRKHTASDLQKPVCITTENAGIEAIVNNNTHKHLAGVIIYNKNKTNQQNYNNNNVKTMKSLVCGN